MFMPKYHRDAVGIMFSDIRST